nr:hypothetical protein [Tanacetum cinerariifolium]
MSNLVTLLTSHSAWPFMMKLTLRVQELTMICTKMVPEEEDRVEKFIGDLPDNIQRNVIAAEPMRLQDAVQIANNLMDQKLKGYAVKMLKTKGGWRSTKETSMDNSHQCWRAECGKSIYG